MVEVVSSVREVAGLMREISSASASESMGIEQVGEAVMQMDLGTQQNSAMVEEMAAAANGLNSEARRLVDAVAVFKVAETRSPRLGVGFTAA